MKAQSASLLRLDGASLAALRERRLLTLAFLLGLLATALRDPIFFLHPRFWAEEATVYFAMAFNDGGSALWRPALGYYSLIDNVAAQLAANVVPLEDAPLVTTLIALLVHAVPLWLVLFGRLSFLPTPWHRLVAAALVVVTPPWKEVLLNTINSQFHLALATALILLEDEAPLETGARWGRRLVLVVSGLSGPVSCFLVPLYLLRAVWRRRREHAAQAALLTVCALLEAGVVWHGRAEHAKRRAEFDPAMVATAVGTRVVVEPVLGSQWGREVVASIQAKRTTKVRSRNIGITVAVAVAVLSALLLVRRQPRGTAILHLGSALVLAVLCLVGSIGTVKSGYINVGGGERYFYAPGVLWNLLLLAVVRWGPSHFERARALVAGGLLAASLGVNILAVSRYSGHLDDMPRWREQVRRWREDPRQPLEVWPGGWFVHLNGQNAR
ncbi:hypothetical protein HPC49_09740 [Pyxidicoccus fallax]|uniref:DUF2029 domain-containing protein n=1 Tax=Pyxidicoccus fallax TaxID=394095 RepID=A0A848L488_9BACT|nr:hypothetical protein [Pyxidicoccus fallax]NMO13524.1 hypothetical protein [Pyxidicoccus fallax]NPC78525.1 hypothetical protein [Pyxidicoccus fallax]